MKDEKDWEIALSLWKRLSEKEDQPNLYSYLPIKERTLTELGYPEMKFSCPFCEKYYRYSNECDGCPISYGSLRGCVKHTPYKEYSDEIEHSQLLAKKFYEYLLSVYNQLKKEKES
jgi:hypothetical protein